MKSVLPPNVNVRDLSCHILGVDNLGAAQTAVQYISQLGHRRVGLILGPRSSRDFSERANGFLEALGDIDKELVFEGSYDHDTGREGCKKLLEMEDPPTAILCACDPIALGALDYAKEIGMKCPQELSVIGFDDGPWAMNCFPKLTTMRQPLKRLAQQAVDILMRVTEPDTGPVHQQYIELPASIVLRNSTSAPAGAQVGE
ncbi:LacI family DNA-binding transcriptional regulator [Persicirhabdus sediminis]|uniref:Substrate-binding domain-containing protein n=1 Tax=Persicirhabdus sediminis TaxID=454144 RepID=A0A8J7MF94_9BACT|nr:substrate-binding domain-containing protein [Persicirhabdus sediminis]MBK1791618.1 substrate-binding domain-containing protein [Persicirhabdus sediminis]